MPGRKSTISILLGSTLMLLLIFNQTVAAQGFEINHIDYSYGLSNSQITSLKSDKNGFIWVGTQGGGVYRWDGQDLVHLSDTLKYGIVYDLQPADSSGLWIASDDKLLRFGQYGAYTIKDQTDYLAGEDDVIRCFVSHKGAILSVSARGMICLLDQRDLSVKEKFQFERHGAKMFKMIDKDDGLHFFTDSMHSLITLENEKLVLSREDELKKAIGGKYFSTIHKMEDKWLLQDEEKLYQLNEHFQLEKELKIPLNIALIGIKYFKNSWWLASGMGLMECVLEGNEFVLKKKYINSPVWRMLQTKDNLWVGGLNGLFQVYQSTISLLNAGKPDMSSGYFDFEKVNEEVWAASVNSGIHIYKNGQFADSIQFDHRIENGVRCILADEELVWVGNSRGLLKMDPITRNFNTVPEVKSSIMTLIKHEDKLYAGSYRGGLYVKEGQDWVNYPIARDGNSPVVWSLASADNIIFIGTEAGMFVFRDGAIEKVSDACKYPEKAVTALEVLPGNLLAIGQAQVGVTLWDYSSNRIAHHYTGKNGLSSDYIYFLKHINQKLWIGSSLGVDVADYSASHQVFQLRDIKKIAGAETFLNGIFHNGANVLVSTIAGALKIPSNILDESFSADCQPVIIERIELLSFLGSDDFIIQQLESGANSMKIPAGHGSFKISFNSPDYSKRTVNFQYQLVGYDPEPSEPSSIKSAVYKQVPAGDYVFKVWRSEARIEKGSEAKNVANIAFTVTDLYYNKAWFRAALAIFFILIIMAVMAYRSRLKTQKALQMAAVREEAQNELRKEMALDFHDEMGNHLAKIINLSGVLKMWGLAKEQDDVVHRIERAANALFTSTKDMIWSLKKENNNLEEVYFHVKDFAEQVFENTAINLRSFKNESAVHIHLNAKAGRDLSLILKEAFTNIYKHADAKNVDLKMEVLPKGGARITVSDDGVGFSCEKRKSGNGLKNMKQRAARSGFHLNLQTDLPKGTAVIIETDYLSKS